MGKKDTSRSDASKLNANDDQDPGALLIDGDEFLKWGRRGPKRRFVMFDEECDAIVWKDSKDTKIKGVLPLSEVQDILIGVQTPVMQMNSKGRYSPKIVSQKVLSIVATDRTLDLQAESETLRRKWVAGIKARYKKHVQKQGLEIE